MEIDCARVTESISQLSLSTVQHKESVLQPMRRSAALCF